MEPSDAFLITSMLAGDEAALRVLMDRYDRLVRYAVFRAGKKQALRDPQWVDSVAVAVWTGFVNSMRRIAPRSPDSVSAYLAQLARNQSVSTLRKSSTEDRPKGARLDVDSLGDLESHDDDAATLVDSLNRLDGLRNALEQFDGDDRAMLTQLSAITDRRWRDASKRLGWSESTLRSRWKSMLEKLRRQLSMESAG